jgi:two-component system NtrC family sensor kinase
MQLQRSWTSNKGELNIRVWKEDDMSVFSVTDSGPGIPKDLQKRIFEPFFTTKDAGSGTGLGLSISKNIIEKYGGKIKLQSKTGKGTSFSVFIPTEKK